METISNHPYNGLFIYFCYIFTIGIFLGPTAHDIFSGYINMIAPFILSIIYLPRCKHNNNVFVISLFTSISIILSYVLVGGGIGSVLTNISSVFLAYLFYHYNIKLRDAEIYVKMMRLFQLYLFLFVIITGYNGYEEQYFLGNNPNTLGMQGFFNFVLFFLLPSKQKIFQITLIVSCLYLIIISNCRTALISSILFFLVFCWTKRHICKRSNIRFLYWTIVLLGVIVPFLYSFFLPQLKVIETITDQMMDRFNKQLFSGREVIWTGAWDLILKNPLNFLMGIGSHFYKNQSYDYFGSDFEMNSNFHSSFFSLFICCGALGYALFMKLLSKIIFKKQYISKYAIDDTMLLIFPLFIVGFSETILFYGSFAIQFYIIITYIKQKRV